MVMSQHSLEKMPEHTGEVDKKESEKAHLQYSAFQQGLK